MILGFIFDSAAAVGALFYSPTTIYDRSDNHVIRKDRENQRRDDARARINISHNKRSAHERVHQSGLCACNKGS